MGDYKCSKCGEVVTDDSGPWGGMYEWGEHRLMVKTQLCYCYHCHKYSAVQVGIKRQHLWNIKAQLEARYSLFDRLFDTEAYKKVKHDVKVCKLLECILDRVTETYTSCVKCGSNAVLLVNDLSGSQHHEKCDGHLVQLPVKDTGIRFRWLPGNIYPVVRPMYKFSKSEKIEDLEKNVVDYFWIR